MVSIVLVSHLENTAKAAVELVSLMAKGAKIVPAGGNDSGGAGASVNKITDAVNSVYSDDGVLLIADIGSSVMNSRAVALEMTEKGKKVVFADCPFIEGAIAAGVTASCGLPLQEILKQAEKCREMKKK